MESHVPLTIKEIAKRLLDFPVPLTMEEIAGTPESSQVMEEIVAEQEGLVRLGQGEQIVSSPGGWSLTWKRFCF